MAAHDSRATASFGLYDLTNAWEIPVADPGMADKWAGILSYGLLLTAPEVSHTFDGYAYPALLSLLPQRLVPPIVRIGDPVVQQAMTQLDTWLQQQMSAIALRLNNSLRGHTDGLRFSRLDSEPGDSQDGDVRFFNAGAVGAEEGMYALINGTWTKL